MECASKIPIIDLKNVSIDFAESSLSNTTLKLIGNSIVKAFTDVGFLYIKNHGIPKEVIEHAFEQSQLFFETLPLQEKLKHVRDWEKTFYGYHPRHTNNGASSEYATVEQFDLNAPPDAKETYNLIEHAEDSKWPLESLPQFKPQLCNLIHHAHKLYRRMMLLLAYGFDELEDKYYFLNGIKELESINTKSAYQIRLAYYEKLKSDEFKPGMMRCGEHSDFLGLTFVFQDAPGLQIYSREKVYIDVEPIEDTIVVNVADLMQRWTGNRLKSAKHRVILNEHLAQQNRLSMIYFGGMDDNFIIQSNAFGDTNLFEPITTAAYAEERMKDIFVKGKGVRDELEL